MMHWLRQYKFFILTILLVISSFDRIHSQDPIFSQYYSTPLQINSAFTGLTNGPRIGVNYRNQWPLIDQTFKTYVTYNIFYDQYYDKIKSGFGLELTSDVAGDGFIRTNKVNALYGYKIPITRDRKHVIKGGLELGFTNISFDWDKFIFGDQIDPVYGYQTGGGVIVSREIVPASLRKGYVDAGLGVLYYSPKYYFGVAAKHLNAPDIGILANPNDGSSSLPTRFAFHGGMEIELAGHSKSRYHLLSPSVVFLSQSAFRQVNIGTLYQIGNLLGGIYYRNARINPDALILSIGVKRGYWKLGYSFDFTLSDLTIAQGGSHEISFLFSIGNAKKTSNVSDCFEAFR